MKKVFLFISLSFFFSNSFLFSSPVDSLLIKLDSTQINEEQIHILLELCNKQHNLDFKNKWIYANKALRYSNHLGYEKGVALSNLNLGIICKDAGLIDQVIDYFKDALQYFKNQNDFHNIALTTYQIGHYYSILNNYEKSLEYYRDYYSIAQENNFIEDKTIALAQIGYIYLQFNTDSALVYLNKAIDIIKKENLTIDYFSISANIAAVYFLNGDYKKSIEFLPELESGVSDKSVNTRINLYYLFGMLNYKTGQTKRADFYFDKADSLKIDTSDYPKLGDIYQIKFISDTMQHDYKSAINNYINYSNFIIKNNKLKFENNLANFQAFYELEEKNTEIESLLKENEIIILKSKQSKLLLFIQLIVIVSFLGIFFLIFRLLKVKSKKNKLLNLANFELKEQKEELVTLNEEISSQREELFDKNTELVSTLEQLKETQTRLIHADKMASIGTLAAGIAHEINNPLNFIVGGLEIVNSYKTETCFENSEEMNDALQMIKEGAERSTNIVKSLMSYTNKSGFDFALTDVNKILDYSLDVLRFEISQDITVEKKYTDSFTLNCFKDKLLQVFISIIKNSLDSFNVAGFNRPKVIKIETKFDQEADKKYGLIVISNSGPHILDEILPEIFDPFFTTKDPNKGTGLGLTTSYNIIKEHKGSIIVKNNSKGVETSIRIPV